VARPITATIITLNEERNVEAAVASALLVCDEVIVVDSESTDRTRELAEKAGARVLVQAYLGDGKQKDFGVDHAKNEWILSLDADERLDADAVAALSALDFENAPHDAYALRRKTFIGKRFIRVWYPDYVTRLYDRRRCRYLPVGGHSHVDAKNLRRLSCHLLHYSFADYGDYMRRSEKFSTRGARILFEKGRRASALGALLHGAGAFLRQYIVRGGIFHGLDGLIVAVTTAHGVFMKYAMLAAMNRERRG